VRPPGWSCGRAGPGKRIGVTHPPGLARSEGAISAWGSGVRHITQHPRHRRRSVAASAGAVAYARRVCERLPHRLSRLHLLCATQTHWLRNRSEASSSEITWALGNKTAIFIPVGRDVWWCRAAATCSPLQKITGEERSGERRRSWSRR
jgi:hypothetical protein